jgi:hypothetical protein
MSKVVSSSSKIRKYIPSFQERANTAWRRRDRCSTCSIGTAMMLGEGSDFGVGVKLIVGGSGMSGLARIDASY